jgi:hypothetical protein
VRACSFPTSRRYIRAAWKPNLAKGKIDQLIGLSD